MGLQERRKFLPGQRERTGRVRIIQINYEKPFGGNYQLVASEIPYATGETLGATKTTDKSISPIIRRGLFGGHTFQIDVSGIDGREPNDHLVFSVQARTRWGAERLGFRELTSRKDVSFYDAMDRYLASLETSYEWMRPGMQRRNRRHLKARNAAISNRLTT